uniref:arginine--tRNA ligase n=1 Tax=Globodera rostochiensis TaxID=31243 RepID=A0A914HD92_GLORO
MDFAADKKRISLIEQVLGDMEKGNLGQELMEECPDLAAKLQERDKLEYQLNILKRTNGNDSTGSEQQIKKKLTNGDSIRTNRNEVGTSGHLKIEDFGDSIIERLNSVFSKAVKTVYPMLSLDAFVKEASNPKFGDYQFDMAMQISRRLLSEHSVKETAGEVAKKIVAGLENIALVEKYKPVNAYVNVFISRQHLGRRIAEIFKHGFVTPKIAKKHVVVDYSSPNIAKQMHVGHLRSTIIGEAISRLLDYVGFSVLRLNHIGDWGTQFGMLIAHLKKCFPNYLNETPPIQDLQQFYKESKVKFDEDPQFKAEAYRCVVQLQNFEPDIVKAWKMICDVSRKDFAEIYERLGSSSLVERGESFYQSRMQLVVQELEQAGVLCDDDGRKLFFPEGCNIPLTVVKSDGGFTYDTSDLATLKQRLFEERADWVLYVVDRGQSEHLENIFAAGLQLRWYEAEQKRVEHVQFGLVLGEDRKKFKTRSGDNVKLMDLLDEGVRRAEEKLRSKGRDEEFTSEQFREVAESVAYGCIRYADMSQSRTGDYVFSFDRMLDDRGNTAVYLLYAYARIRSIARNAQVTRDEIDLYIKGLTSDGVPLDHPREIKLAKQILKFSDVLLSVIEGLQLNKICDYVYELATMFHDFYKDCYVVSKLPVEGEQTVTKVNFNRLVLCEVTADVMQRCFNILGIRALERM